MITEAQTVIAKTTHRCTFCGGQINVKEAYIKWSSSGEGGWFTNKMHPECHQVLLDDADGFDFEYTPYSGERPTT